MDYKILTEAERKYTFSQSNQLSMQTGLIGYMRADFGSNGKEFWTTWNDFRKDLKTEDFKKEFDLIINSFRYGDGTFLSGRTAMNKFCYEHPESSYDDERKARNTDNHLYLMVLEHYSGLRGIDIHAMTVPVFLKELDRRSFPGFETVRRSRQKVQATYPDLAPSEAVGKRRAKNEVEYREFAESEV